MAGLRRCLALMVLAVGAVHAKRTLNQVPEALAAAQSSITQASGMASETISKATESFAGQAKVADDSVSAQFDAAKKAATDAIPKELSQSAGTAFNSVADSLLPADFKAKVDAAIKNFKAGDAKNVDPQMKNYAKLMAGVIMLDNSGDSNIANQKLGDLLKMLVDFTFDLIKVYATAPAKIITELPQDLGDALAHSQPQNFAAWFADHKQVYTDLLGLVYKNGTRPGSANHPDSVDISGNFISYSPCIISNTPTGFAFGATGFSITPQVFQAAPTGANIQPQAINIQPALIYFFPAGFNVQPQGLNIAPTLIGVTPGGYSNVAVGGLIGGSLIGVSAEQAP